MSTPQLEKKRKSEEKSESSEDGEEQFFTPKTGWTPKLGRSSSKLSSAGATGPRKHIRFDQLSSVEEKEILKELEVHEKSKGKSEEVEEEDSEAEPEATSFSRAETETKRQRQTIEDQVTQRNKAEREKEKQRQDKRLAEKKASRKRNVAEVEDEEQELLPSHLIDKFKKESILLADSIDGEDEQEVSEPSSPEPELGLKPLVNNKRIIKKGNILVEALPANTSEKTIQPRAQIDVVKKKAKMLVRPSQHRRPVRRRL